MNPFVSFSDALAAIKRGSKMIRSGWNGKGMWVRLKDDGGMSEGESGYPNLPYIVIEYPVGHSAYPAGCSVPWLASQTDMLAEDWTEYTP